MILNLTLYEPSGKLQWKYSPLKNILNESNKIVDFKINANDFKINILNSVDMLAQQTYDGTVNLIINDDSNPPKIVNSRFTKIEDNGYRIINRNQKEQTNLYKINKIDQQTRLFRTIDKIPKIDLVSVNNSGRLKGGNYIFYIQYADEDFNKTNIVAESGVVSIFHGKGSDLSTYSGTLLDERTDKNIILRINNIDTSFSKVYISYTRTTSDLNGYRKIEQVNLKEPYDIIDNDIDIMINGFEEELITNVDKINEKYNVVNAVKTQTIVQNRLFFANVEKENSDSAFFQNLSYYIGVEESTDNTDATYNLGYIHENYKTSVDDITKLEYYNPLNIYHYVGYWPEEIYRLGVVYIMNNDELSPVYNLRGIRFNSNHKKNILDNDTYKEIVKNDEIQFIPNDIFIDNDIATYRNTRGIFKCSDQPIINNNEIKPIYFKMSLNATLVNLLIANGVKGLFFVRQRRIPMILGQGLSIGVNQNCFIPMLFDNNSEKYIGESFKDKNNILTTEFERRLLTTNNSQCGALLSLDSLLNKDLSSKFIGTKFILKQKYDTSLNKKNRHFKYVLTPNEQENSVECSLIWTAPNTEVNVLKNLAFSSQVGNDRMVSEFGWWTNNASRFSDPAAEMIRGQYTGFIGTDSIYLNPSKIYNICTTDYANSDLLFEFFEIRAKDESPFMAISDRYAIDDNTPLNVKCYRGDCFTNTATIRLNKNFIDPNVSRISQIVDENTWAKNYKGYYNAESIGQSQEDTNKKLEDIAKAINKTKDSTFKEGITYFSKINRADVNNVPLGMWVTYKCLSSYNLGLRAIDHTNADEIARMGERRTFYPLYNMFEKNTGDQSTLYKMEDSYKLNDGYNSTVGNRLNILWNDMPYNKDQFDNRIMFSSLHSNNSFKNAFRIFEGLGYQDIDRQYGAIVKILPYLSGGSPNILAVFEHGIGVVGINEKALINTDNSQSIQIKGAGVITPEIAVITDDYGSTWKDSIIRTPMATYGVDTFAKKIWQVKLGGQGIQNISDMSIQSFLNDNIIVNDSDSMITGIKNVKTHYNNNKGDVIFTFYCGEKEWSICYNERMGAWTTRYSWIPLVSDNINNSFYSFDKKHLETLFNLEYYKNTLTDIKLKENNIYKDGENVAIEKICGININADNYTDLEIRSVVDNFNIDCTEDFFLSDDRIQTNKELKSLYYIVEIQYTGYIAKCCLINLNYTALKKNGLYLHGYAGNFEQINNFDFDQSNNICSAKWYDKQEPFEFEFVVSKPTGHKIFENLVIISNNAEPDSIEYEVEGDVYGFNKKGIYWKDKEWDTTVNPMRDQKYQVSQELINAKITWDNSLNSYSIRVTQPIKNIQNSKFRRLLGNAHYKEDSWYITIDPIRYQTVYKPENTDTTVKSSLQNTRIRDKYCKIRVKYKGDNPVIITALKTIATMSYA